MPCYDSRDTDRSYISAEAVKEARITFRHNSDVAELLCSTLKQLERIGQIDIINSATQQWWDEHKLRDAAKGKP